MQNLVEIGSLVPEKKLKIFKSLQTTKTFDGGQKHITIGHLGDSSDLKTK